MAIKPIKPGKPVVMAKPKPRPTSTAKPKPKQPARKTSQSKPPSLAQQFATNRERIAQNAIDSAFNVVGRINNAGSKTTIKKGGPRPKMKRMAQPALPKRMAQQRKGTR